MDSVIKFIKDKESVTYGASRLGYEDTFFYTIFLIIRYLKKDELSEVQNEYLKEKLFKINEENIEDYECIFLLDENELMLDLGRNITKVKDLKDTYGMPNFNFSDEEILLKTNLTYDEFLSFYDFFLKVKTYDEVLINHNLIYKINIKR